MDWGSEEPDMRRETRRWCQALMMGGLLVGSPGLTAEPDGGTSPHAVAAESDAERQFREWLERRATEARLKVRTLWRGDLDGDQVPERVALLCTREWEEGQKDWYVIEKSPSERWLLEQGRNTGGKCTSSEEEAQGGPDAGAPRSKPWLALGPTLELSDGYSRWETRVEVALRDGVPSRVALESWANDMGIAYYSAEDWARLRFKHSERNTLEEDYEEDYELRLPESALIPVLAREQPLPPTVNHVTFGKKHWSGEADASLQVSVLQEGPDAVRVRLKVRDDVARPAPVGADLARFIASDHLELWWKMGWRRSWDTPKTPYAGVRQLGIALREDGSVDARWLFPEKTSAALPKVELRQGRVEVVLPLGLLGIRKLFPPQRESFTAAWSDSDTPASGQQTLVATSVLQWGVPESFSLLVFNEEGRRYPSPGHLGVGVEVRRLEGDVPLRGK
jgi:hypothetical protein